MSTGKSTWRYYGGLAIATLVLIGSSLGISWLADGGGVPQGLLAVLAVVPVAALLSMFWVHWRYLRDLDEYLRQLHVKALLCGTAVALGIGTGWGYLEMLVDAPALAVYWLNPIYWISYAIAVSVLSRRDSAGAA